MVQLQQRQIQEFLPIAPSATAAAKGLWKRATAPISGGSSRVTRAQLLIIRPLLPSDFTEDPTPASGAMLRASRL